MKNYSKKFIRQIYYLLLRLGFDLKQFFSIVYLFKYFKQLEEYKKLEGTVTHLYPILLDYKESAGSTGGHYFDQDLLVANFIFERNPINHYDIGSRIDGFVAHVAAFRKINVIDVRSLPELNHKNINFLRADIMDINSSLHNVTDSLSCLHAVEHFGLGRYGDNLDPNGHKRGFENMCRMLSVDGMLYISFPIGNSNKTYFNAHRVFHPLDIFSWVNDFKFLKIERFDYIDDLGLLHRSVDLINESFNVNFGCGIYSIKKISN